MPITRRAVLLSSLAAGAAPVAPKPVDTHIHLFDPAKFPYHPAGTYKPPAEPLERYLPFASKALRHSIIVHPEPYQDDHAYLEYCLQNEPRKGFFKGTCLFDAFDPKTPARMEALSKKWPGRIVALRIHAVSKKTETSGPIKNRDLADPRMAETWAAAAKLGMAIQMHMIPYWAPAVGKLAARTSGVKVVIDHLCRFGEGTAAEYEEVLKLGSIPGVYMKFSGLSYSSKQPSPHKDLIPLAERLAKSFTPARIVWGGVGMNEKQYEQRLAEFETIWAFLSAKERDGIRGANAAKLFRLG